MSTTLSTKSNWKGFLMFAIRVMIVHTITYFIFGILMSNIFDYGEIFKREIIRDYMLPIDQHNVLIGPFLQPLRGLIFAIGLWPFHNFLIEQKRGWLYLWGLIATIGILSTPAAAPSSIEGILYSRLPMWYHLMGLPEILLQTLVFSIWLVWWERQAVKGPQAAKRENPLVSEIVKAIMTACFAYIGYAVGGLLLAARANATAAATGSDGIDIEAAGASFKMQFMFVIAFLINTIIVFWLARRRQTNKIPLWGIFLLFWFIDVAVPWLYQTIVFGSSHIPTAILLGFFPAVIITASMKMSYRKPSVEARSSS
jgi:hypothetical protein